MQSAMSDHHYFLQYYMYGVALHRHLARRLRDYEFERHFGGVFYLFIRGMSPDAPDRGVFFDRPPFTVIETLDRTLQGLALPEARP
jgi:exodeoxyribonuclease V beta subunit